MATRSDRLSVLRLLWAVGAAVLWRLVLFVALIGAGVYALLGAAAWLLGFDPLRWFLVTALIWGPLAAGCALGAMMRRIRLDYLRRHPEGTARLELVAGWSIGGLGLRERPSWVDTAAVLMVMGGILAVDLSPLVLAIELVTWLASGAWVALAVGAGLALPPSFCLFAVGLLLCLAGLELGDLSLRGNAAGFPRR